VPTLLMCSVDFN